MIVIYWCFGMGDFDYKKWRDIDIIQSHRPSECRWIVPGTINPED